MKRRNSKHLERLLRAIWAADDAAEAVFEHDRAAIRRGFGLLDELRALRFILHVVGDIVDGEALPPKPKRHARPRLVVA